jgi:hypothetical protein
LVFAVILLFLSALHIYWALGGEWGSAATIPTVDGRRTLDPSPAATYGVAFLLALAAGIICAEARLFSTGPLAGIFHLGAWCIAGVFLLRTIGNFHTFGFFKTVRDTPFAYWDTHLYSPLCLALAVLAAVVASASGVK